MKYKVCLSTKVNPKTIPTVPKNSYILVIEPDDYTTEQVKAIKKKGYTLLAYLSVGTIEKERSFYDKYKKYGLKRLKDWPNEVYADVRKTNWRCFLVNRAKSLKKRGYDGFWCDNLDVYEYYKSEKMFAACKAVLKQLKALGYIMVNGGSEFWDVAMDRKVDLTKLVSGVTQEEVFSLIKNYSGKGTFGVQKASESTFYQKLLQRLMRRKIQTYMLEYTRDEKVKEKIRNFCKQGKATGYYISGDVNL